MYLLTINVDFPVRYSKVLGYLSTEKEAKDYAEFTNGKLSQLRKMRAAINNPNEWGITDSALVFGDVLYEKLDHLDPKNLLRQP